MIILKEGTKERAHKYPCVMAEIEPGRIWGTWWYEISYWDYKEKTWVLDWERDGGGFFLWNQWKKADNAMQELWFELSKEHD